MGNRSGDSVLADLFGLLDTAVVERREDGHFAWLGSAPAWWARLYPELSFNAADAAPDSWSPFLDNFLVDAEGFWSGGEKGQLRSGIWYENDALGSEYHLEATAFNVQNRRLLLVELQEAERNERWRLIQKGRENQLDYLRRLAKRQQVEEILRYVQADLEKQVVMRTVELRGVVESLHREVEERRQTEEQLRTALHEKEALLGEVHHRVKNNLQVIRSLLDLQTHYVEDDEALSLLIESRNRVQSMALVHENLYQMELSTEIEFDRYLASLAAQLQEGHQERDGEISLKFETEAAHLDLAAAVPCGLIMNELVSNAFKHAFPPHRRGQIGLFLRQVGEAEVEVGVWDDGIGLPANFDVRRPHSLGFTLINTLVRQLDRGRLEVESAPHTRFTIAFRAARAG